MIRITIKVSNDNCSLVENFEAECVTLSIDDEYFKSMIESVITKFNQPVDDVVVKTRMEV